VAFKTNPNKIKVSTMEKVLLLIVMAPLISVCQKPADQRTEISLNGIWNIAKTDSITQLSSSFVSEAPVPGLVDMASPVIDKQDTAYISSAYWYKRTLIIDDNSPEVIRLKINKARYHTYVFINGKQVGENVYNFTPVLFDIKPFLNSAGQKNELIVAVGCMNNLPNTVTNGSDFEKTKYIPGIYDDVKILISDYPVVQNVQIAPDLKKNSARVVADLLTKNDEELKVDYAVSEVSSGK
jgi:beta-galactosidase